MSHVSEEIYVGQIAGKLVTGYALHVYVPLT